ncbi:tryptophan synthase subunit beta [Candidatus Haliotispira prima]|uniref:Tryptophan synthase beta chain n=1 Tax=Candidatus Haliotispira prima TaxID=3034016 RepID=A0ABY8MIY5_9SPIO|nr:tryptophan synthase subunit beta [Candidatus Haliotispira prima]
MTKESTAKESGPIRDYWGEFGGCFVPETLVPTLSQLKALFLQLYQDPKFTEELRYLEQNFSGRPTPLYEAKNLSRKLNCRLFLKREDLLHTGAHKINNTLGQGLLAKYMGKKRVIAETGAGQHGVATATTAALLGLQCVIFMGEEDTLRQAPNVQRMKLLGAEVVSVQSGSRTLKDAVNAALQDWVSRVEDTHYILGSVSGPSPFPSIVAYFHECIGRETAAQLRQQYEIEQPDAVIACVGGGSNAIGMFRSFIDMPADKVQIYGIEAGGISDAPGRHARTIGLGEKGVLHGYHSLLLQDDFGAVAPVHSISAGLDYPGIGPEHAALHASKRVHYDFARDHEALDALTLLAQTEGIIPALESSHALAFLLRESQRFQGGNVVLNLSGRGDKDLAHYFAAQQQRNGTQK